ncbi:MAG: hypothetical protein A3K19_22565 [Lentisphaerae bacterium RIFOXYB12_FULL_65_16]|nr:MAG: hypothetical protein A3K19_22565 [Lentisphaerae bacterium RIFOXYB12_FULL_65_16]
MKLDVGATLVVEKATPEGRGKVMGELASRYAKADRVARLGILRILANWPVPESTRFLGGILENDWDWREAAAGCLGTQATEEATDLLATYVFGSGRDPSERVLRPLARSRAGRQQLWRNLDVTSPTVRCWILDALVGYDIPEDGLSRQAVERLLKDPAPEVREAAERAQERLRK